MTTPPTARGDDPHSESHPVPAGHDAAESCSEGVGIELFPVNFTAYRHHPDLETDAHVRAIADLLAPYGPRITPWDVPADERDRQAVEERLGAWKQPAASGGGNSVLYWVGHGSGDHLAHHRTASPIDDGVSPYDIARAIAGRRLHPDNADNWAIVVLDACFSTSFARAVHIELLTRFPDAGRYLLLSTASLGYTDLGAFTRALHRALAVTFRGQPAIALFELGFELSQDLRGHRADTTDRRDQLVRLFPDAATAVSAPLDQLAEIQAVIDQLPADERRHFLPKASGAELGELAWYFHGRALERDLILRWLDTATSGALVVTGPAGAGKSALLGHVLLHTRTHLRDILIRHGHLQPLPDGIPCPDDPFDLTVHLAGLTLARVVHLIAQAAGLPDLARQAIDGQPPDELADELLTRLRTRRTRLTMMFDALDEAEQPLTIAHQLLGPLAALPTVSLIVGTRSSTHEGPDRPAPADTNILDALRPRLNDPDAPGHPVAEGPQYVEVSRDPKAIAGYLRAKLHAAKHRGTLRADYTLIEEAVDRLATDDQQDGAEPQQFLYARLAAHELLNDPYLITDPTPLIGRTHRQLFTRALERLHHANPHYTPLLKVLGLAQGRGLPDQDGIWAASADALAPGSTATRESIPGLLRDAAPYLALDQEHDQSVYRLAHRTFTEHFTTAPDTPYGHAAITTALTRHAHHTLQARDMPGATTPQPEAFSPYIRHHLAAHARLGHTAGALRALADHPDVLDTLDLTSITAIALHHGLTPSDLPPAIAGTLLHQHHARDTATSYQESGTAGGWRRWWRRLGTAYIQGTPPPAETRPRGTGPWPPTLTAGSVRRRRLHLQLTGHTSTVWAVAAFTASDGTPRLASSGHDGTVRIWNPITGTQEGEPLVGHTSGVNAVAVFAAPDGTPRLATGSQDGTVRVWNPITGTQEGEPLVGHVSDVKAVAVFDAPDGTPRLATAGLDGTTRIWDPATGAQVGPPLSGGTDLVGASGILTGRAWLVFAVAVFAAPDGTPRLATGGRDGTVWIWNPATGTQEGEALVGHVGDVKAVAVFAAFDGTPRLATADDETLQIWDPATGAQVGPPLTSGTERIGRVYAIAVFAAPDGTPRLATTGPDEAVSIWNPATGSQERKLRTPRTDWVNAVAVFAASDGTPRLAIAGDRTLRIWNPATGRQEKKFRTLGIARPHVVAVFAAPDGTPRLAVAGDRTVRVWDPATGRQEKKFRAPRADWVKAVAVLAAPDGTPRLAIAADRTVRIWDPTTATQEGEPLTGLGNFVRAMAVFTAPDGTPRLATIGDDETVHIWNPRTRTERVLPLADPVYSLTAGHGLLIVGTASGHLVIDVSSVSADTA
ncbi:hypothetical protein [Streptomyces yangpuensis]